MRLTPECTCARVFQQRTLGQSLHSITCVLEAVTQPHALIDPDGGIYYPDNPDDAEHFRTAYGAIPIGDVYEVPPCPS